MFIYRCGQRARKGIYWGGARKKIVLKEDGCLPGKDGEVYFRLPESYALIPLVLLPPALALTLPFNAGIVISLFFVALAIGLYLMGSASYRLMKEMLGRTATFGYAPTTAYMAGKKTKKAKREDASLDEERTDAQ